MILLHLRSAILPKEIVHYELNAVLGDDIIPMERDIELLNEMLLLFLTNCFSDIRVASAHADDLSAKVYAKILSMGMNLVKLLVEVDIASECVVLKKIEIESSTAISSVIR